MLSPVYPGTDVLVAPKMLRRFVSAGYVFQKVPDQWSIYPTRDGIEAVDAQRRAALKPRVDKSERNRRIMDNVIDGEPVKEIAARYGISVSNVRKIAAKALQKKRHADMLADRYARRRHPGPPNGIEDPDNFDQNYKGVWFGAGPDPADANPMDIPHKRFLGK